jgi:cystathionine gamma-synthase/cystathionine gamma-lyase/cystathionine beta-lyase
MTPKPANTTTAIHAGALTPRPSGAIGTPIFQASTYEYHGEDYHDIGYMRLSTSPNHRVLAARIAALEGSESALATGSGMASISAVLFTLLSTGDHILVQDCLYGGTTGLLTSELARMGITHTAIDPQDPGSWAAHLQPTTRAIYVETLTNPTVQMADLESVVPFAREHGLVSVIDNTFATPVNFRPAASGFDLVVESCTKFMNGHTDIIAGSVAGSAHHVAAVKRTLDHLGGVLDTHTCFLLERGLKTLPIRMQRHNDNALAVARFLDSHAAVEAVHYPGLTDYPYHERAVRLLAGFGGMVAFEVKGGVEAADRFLARLTLPVVAVSLGGAESLIIRPAAAIHGELSAEERAQSGIRDGLIRFSVGLEDEADLLEDLEQALAG